MFDVGFWELIILFGLGLIILGPERLPKVAMKVGNWAGQARRMARQLSTQIRSELHDLEVNDPFPSEQNRHPAQDFSRPGMEDLDPSAHDTVADTDEKPDTAPQTDKTD